MLKSAGRDRVVMFSCANYDASCFHAQSMTETRQIYQGGVNQVDEMLLLTRALLRYTLPFQLNKNVLICALYQIDSVKFSTYENKINYQELGYCTVLQKKYVTKWKRNALPPMLPSFQEMALTPHLQEVGLLSPFVAAPVSRCSICLVSQNESSKSMAHEVSIISKAKSLTYRVPGRPRRRFATSVAGFLYKSSPPIECKISPGCCNYES